MPGAMRLVRRNGSGPHPVTVGSVVRLAICLVKEQGFVIDYESATHVVLWQERSRRLVVLYK